MSLKGYVFDDAGAAKSGVEIKVFEKNTTSPALTTDPTTVTTNSDGLWAAQFAPSDSDETQVDVQGTLGSSVFRWKYDDKIAVSKATIGDLILTPSHNFSFIFAGIPAADRTITFSDNAGTVALLEAAQTFSAAQTFTGTFTAASTTNQAATIYLRENAGTSGTIKIHADQGTSVTEGAESINILSDAGGVGIRSTANLAKAVNITSDGGTTGSIAIFNDQGTSVTEGAESISLLSDAGGVGIRSTANLANAVNLTVDGGTSSTMTLFNDQGTAATEGAASIQLLSDVGGINIKSGLDAANAILLTADGGTSETIKIHADQGTGTGSIELLSDAGGIELDAGTDIILDAGGADIFLKDDGTLFGTLTNNSGELLIKSSSSGTTAATFSGANVTFAGTVDATTDFTVGTTVITDDVVTFTPSTSDTVTLTASTNGAFSLVTVDNAAAAANIQITADGTVDIDSAGVLTLDSGAAINLEPASGSAILLDGTISVDAGVVTGATSITVGHTAQVAMQFGNTPELQVLGTSAGNDGGLGVGLWEDGTSGSRLYLIHSRSGTIGTSTALQSGDQVGAISFGVADGSDHQSEGGRIEVVTEALAATNDVPCRMIFGTAANGAASVTEAIRIDQSQDVTFASMPTGSVTNIGHAGNVITIESSSRELKDNERSLEVDSALLYQLVPKTFEWNDKSVTPGITDHGFIAQDVHAVIPEAVNMGKDRERKYTTVDGSTTGKWEDVGDAKPQAIRLAVLVPLVISEMKKLEARLSTLETA